MSKRYIHGVEDVAITNAAELKAVADTNPSAYLVGGLYSLPNGVLCIVSANSGTAVTVLTVTAA
jgi:hypothetical protein